MGYWVKDPAPVLLNGYGFVFPECHRGRVFPCFDCYQDGFTGGGMRTHEGCDSHSKSGNDLRTFRTKKRNTPWNPRKRFTGRGFRLICAVC